MKTISTTKKDALKQRRWLVVDAEGKVLGRIASEIASVLRGKHQVTYTPHVDTGDFVIVLNAEKVRLTGRKESDKIYHHHTNWAGGVVSKTAATLREENASELIKNAVWGMMPKGPLGRAMFKKLKVYTGSEHPHTAQKPEPLTV
ncbi:MAG TPA: 50S ribosomal protein L13 [Myxococcota bacterium]|nr:50S ribosomal protein L13 [Myxococcota bacterium]